MKNLPPVHYLLILIVLCATLGCKKSNSAQPSTPFIYGTLNAWMAGTSIDSGGAGYYEWADAVFYDSSNANSAIDVGNIVVNGNDTTLQFPYNQQVGVDYKFENGVRWDMPATAKWPAFSFSTQGSFPFYKGNIPDTIDALNGVSFNVSNAITNNADSVKITIVNNVGQVYITCEGNETARFTSESLEFLSNNSSGYNFLTVNIIVQASKFDYQIVNGKKFQFIRTYEKSGKAYLR